MDMMATRIWGVLISGTLLATALAAAVAAPPQRPLAPSPAVAAAADRVVAAPQAPVATSLLVTFRGNGRLARAGRNRSARGVATQLHRQRQLRGLCFAGFNGQRMVLRACGGATLGAWPQRLRAMHAVASVEPGE
jgi:hypothetical protein